METDLNLHWPVQMTSDQWWREVQLAAERWRDVQWVWTAAERREV